MCLDENIMNLKKEDFTHEKTKYNLCYTNAMRKKINKEKMDQAVEANRTVGRKKVFHLKSYVFDERSQDVSVLPGMPIIARMNNKDLNIMNNEMFRITKADAEFITITSSENESIACMSINTSEFTKLFNIGFCITIHCAQGCSFDHPFTIYEWEKLDKRLRYVLLSRSRKREYINLIFILIILKDKTTYKSI